MGLTSFPATEYPSGMRIAGIVLDLHDDPKGLVLRNKLASSGVDLPKKLASYRPLDEEQRDALPDRLFALVATSGDETVRKFAMDSAENLSLSLIYFDETHRLLPYETQQKVACNLINGCSWYEVDPPEGLVKIALNPLSALNVGLGVMDMASKAREGSMQGRANMDAFRQAQASGSKIAAGRTIDLSLDEDQAMQKGDGPEAGHIFGPLGLFSQHDATHRKLDEQLSKRDQLEPVAGGNPGKAKGVEVSKKADLNGTDIMPQSTLRSVSTRNNPSRLGLPQKTSAAKIAEELIPVGWQHCGDLSIAEPPTTRKVASHTNFALPHVNRYPIDTEQQVKTAMAYFDEHVMDIAPIERRVFAFSVGERAQELGVKTAGRVLDYLGEGYGPFIEGELHARIAAYEGTGRSAGYEVLLEKKAEISPMIMADMLREVDGQTGAAEIYGRLGLKDPYAAVYGSAKLASAQKPEDDAYSWCEGNDYVSGIQLSALSKRGLKLDELFGQEFADEFQKDPIGTFKSMPSPQKVVLSRLASDSSAGTFRV